MKVYKIMRGTAFQPPRKVGLDSDTVINILNNRHLFASILKELSQYRGVLHIHQESLREVGRKANNLKSLIKEYKIKIVPKNKNNPLLKKMKEECRNKGIEFHPPDSWIIADFKYVGVNKVYSGNKHVIDACKLFNMDISQTPTVDRKIKDVFRELYKFKFRHK